MKQKIAFGLFIALVLVAIPAFAAAPAESKATSGEPAATTAPSTDLTVDEFLTAGAVTTELVSAIRCDVQTLGCNHVNEDCGVIANHCHCKAGGINGSQLICVGNV